MLYFLIGFMGSGKSYTGRNLSELMGIPCIDMDKFIEEQENRSIAEIFEKSGETYFRNLERTFLENLNPKDHLIISTGGGAPCFNDNMDLMNQKGTTIYLNRSKETVMKQLLKGIEKRPLLRGKTEEEIWTFYDNKLSERKQFYEKANIHAADMGYVEISQILKSKSL
ncbi:MAG: shikimate kinase [Chitinophagales bacterium]|nr:shikimate kinase [Chitinophagales bacterium]MCZ2393999.1 shikimate kinase [Chitinophagales bacterium]